jgi:hypothetical protein
MPCGVVLELGLSLLGVSFCFSSVFPMFFLRVYRRGGWEEGVGKARQVGSRFSQMSHLTCLTVSSLFLFIVFFSHILFGVVQATTSFHSLIMYYYNILHSFLAGQQVYTLLPTCIDININIDFSTIFAFGILLS